MVVQAVGLKKANHVIKIKIKALLEFSRAFLFEKKLKGKCIVVILKYLGGRL